MIVTDVTSLGRVASSTDAAGKAAQWHCLARRGMLHSECEAVDYLELPPGAMVSRHGRCGTEEAWYVLGGDAEFDDVSTGGVQRAAAGQLALRPAGTCSIVRNASADTPLRLLLVVVLPRAVSDRLPARSPVADKEADS